MELALPIASLIVSLAALLVTWRIAQHGWSRHDQERIEERIARLETLASTVDERIKDAAHQRVKMGDFMKFEDETRAAIQTLTFMLKDGLHDRLSKAEFNDFKRELRERMAK